MGKGSIELWYFFGRCKRKIRSEYKKRRNSTALEKFSSEREGEKVVTREVSGVEGREDVVIVFRVRDLNLSVAR